MKQLLCALAASFIMLSCSKSNSNSDSEHLQPSQVPTAVMTTYNSRYPSATGQIEWEKEDGNTYKVKFFIGAQRWQAIFNANGTLISEKTI